MDFIYIILLFIGIGIIIFDKIKYKKKEKNIYEEVILKKEKELKEKENSLVAVFQSKKEYYQAEENRLILQRNSLIEEINEKQKFNDSLYKMRKDELERLIEEKRKEKEKELEFTLARAREEKKNQLDNEFKSYLAAQEEIKINSEKVIEEIKSQLAEFQAKRSAINEQLRREEELENEIDFHRIILNQNDKEDIHYLISIEQNIHNKEILYKLIWSEYIQKPFNQMIKNICGSKKYKNVIYCIENIKNHKKYIGKTSAEVSKRWTEHVKNSLNIGGIKRQLVHDAMFGHWDDFTFSIIEEVKDNKLSDREKYYISFFETDKYGYNANRGG